MNSIDLAVLIFYFAILQITGFFAGRNQKSDKDFFTGNKQLGWKAICMSIVATETSSLTILSVPGIAYNGDLRFMQLAFGYILGRIIIALFVLPAYFAGNLETVYEFLQHRFSIRLRKFAAMLFQITRIAGDGVRLFATAIPISILTGWPAHYSIILFMLFTVPYSFFGGLRSVVWADVIQLSVYVLGAVATIIFLQQSEVSLASLPAFKTTWFDAGLQSPHTFFTEPFHIFAGLMGGALLTLSSHGTDQLIVQRTLACRNLKDGQKAIITSGIIVAAQFFLFLILGLYLFAFFKGAAFKSGDHVFSAYIISHLPAGLRGLMLAAIFAAAQSTLSSTLNSLASSAMFDLLPKFKINSPRSRLLLSRLLTLVGAALLTLVALLFKDPEAPVVVVALKIASMLAGGITGVYILGFVKAREAGAWIGLLSSFTGMFFTIRFTALAWTWYVPVGLIYCLSAAFLTHIILNIKAQLRKRA